MTRLRLHSLAYLALVSSFPALCFAHFYIFLPEKPAARPGETVRLRYSFGHPYEHEMVPVDPPVDVTAHAPDGKTTSLSPTGDTAGAPVENKKSKKTKKLVHEYSYEVPRRGDHVLTATAKPVFDGDHGIFLENYLKAVVHARSQRGWDRTVGQKLEIVPLIRPYGLRPGWVFQAKALFEGKAVEGLAVEVEKYNPEPPEGELPEDEFVTRTLRTAPGGVLTCTLDETGWWLINVEMQTPYTRKSPSGEQRHVVLRSTLAVYVGEPLSSPQRK
jgi:uncharacterized GH25 family protein